MALVSPSLPQGKYAVLGVLGLLTAAGLGTLGYQRWADSSLGLFGDSAPGASRTIAAGGPEAAGLTGIEVVDNALNVLTGRSPGERTVGISDKGKGPARAYRYARSPAAQALKEAFSSPAGASRVIEERQSPVAPALVLPPEIFGIAAVPAITEALLPAVGGNPSVGGGSFFSPGGGFSVGGIGGGGAPGDGSANPPPVVTPPGTIPAVPAIPEPATWLMMLLGMAGIGAALRMGKERSLSEADKPLTS